MDERQKNNAKAIIASVVTIVFLYGLAFVFLVPIHEHQTQKLIEENCPDGLENCGLIIDPSPIWMLLGMPAVIVYFVTFKHLENKRFKTWSSYR